MSDLDEIIEAKIEGFDAMRELLLDENAQIFLIKHAFNSAGFNNITEVAGGWFVEYNSFREQMTFEFASMDTLFGNKFAQMSHIGYGVRDADNEIDVYEIQERDKIPPNGTQPTWKAFGSRVDNERYRVITIGGVSVFP